MKMLERNESLNFMEFDTCLIKPCKRGFQHVLISKNSMNPERFYLSLQIRKDRRQPKFAL